MTKRRLLIDISTEPEDVDIVDELQHESRELKRLRTRLTNKELRYHNLTTKVIDDNRELVTKVNRALNQTSFFAIESSCSICLEAVTPQDTILILPCGHYYHLNCMTNYNANSCALCRSEIEHFRID